MSYKIIQYPGDTGSDTLIIRYIDQDRSFFEEREYVVTLSDITLISYISKVKLRKENVLAYTNEYNCRSVKKELPVICFESMAEKFILKHRELFLEEQFKQELEDQLEESKHSKQSQHRKHPHSTL